MIFDTEQQQKQVLRLVLESPVETTIEGVLSGPTQDVLNLVAAIRNGTVLNPSAQDEALALLDDQQQEREDPSEKGQEPH